MPFLHLTEIVISGTTEAKGLPFTQLVQTSLSDWSSFACSFSSNIPDGGPHARNTPRKGVGGANPNADNQDEQLPNFAQLLEMLIQRW